MLMNRMIEEKISKYEFMKKKKNKIQFETGKKKKKSSLVDFNPV